MEIKPVTETVAKGVITLRCAHRTSSPDALILTAARVAANLLVTHKTHNLPTHEPGIRMRYTL